MEREPYIIAELEDLSSIAAPLKSTTRIKYTCFNVSTNLVVMGASSGGLYVFRREPCVFLQLIPSKEGAVVQVAVSPDERLLGLATARGTVSILERNQRGARVVASSYEHSGATVTGLTWGRSELYIGDATGRVSVLARTVFQPPAALLMQLDSQVVQIDAKERLLVVSTMTRCYVCDTERELFRQVGLKLRDGAFGGCFINSDSGENTNEPRPTERARGVYSDSETLPVVMPDGKTSPDYSHLNHLRIFCARPGARVWEGDAEGTVLKTHNFKDALASPARPITTDRNINNNNNTTQNNNQQPVNFGRLLVISPGFLVTHTTDAIYVLDPERSDIVLWCNQLDGIAEVQVTDNVIYVWCETGKMHALNLVPLEKFLIRMYFWKKYPMVTELCLEFSDFLIRQAPHSTKLHLLKDLDEKLKDHGDSSSEIQVLAPLLEVLRFSAQNTQVQTAQKLKSGIYQITRPNYLNLKNRSHSVSPDRVPLKGGSSTSSLPELVMEEEEPLLEVDVAADKELVQAVAELCPRMSVASPRPEEVRELLHRVLRLCDAIDPLNAARELQIRKIFSVENSSAIQKAFHKALTSQTLCALLKDLPAPRNDHTHQYPRRKSHTKETHNDQKTESSNPPNDKIVKQRTKSLICDHEKSSHPEYLMQTIDLDALELDVKMSQVLRIFGDVVKEADILATLKTALPYCYYLSLLQVTKKFEAVAMTLDSSLSGPKALSVVSFLLKVGQIDQICRWSHTLDIHDVTYLVMRREAEDGRAARVLFLSLMDGWRTFGPSDHLLSEENYLLHCLTTFKQNGSCMCGFPVPSPQKQASPRFYKLGTELLECKDDPTEAVQVCGAVPWLWPHLLKMRVDDGLLKLLPLILHLGDLDELERRLPELDSLVCEVLVRHLAGLHKGDCLNCGRRFPSACTPPITWTQAALLLVKAVGHSETLKLLTQYKADVAGLEPVFHRAVVLAAIMEKHSTGLRHSVVDIFSGRSSRQTSLLSPTLQASIFPQTPVTPGPCHWGLKLDPAGCLCPICSLLLSAKVFTDAGVIAFPCRHAFHAVCLRTKDECPVCCENK